jgi:hypothetical protein
MEILTISIDVEQLERFGDPSETLIDFARRVSRERRQGTDYVWTINAANIGRILPIR